MEEPIRDVCFNCANCSTFYLRNVDVCDIDNHPIGDVYSESCGKFWPTDD